MSLIELKDIVKIYHTGSTDLEALKSINLSIDQRELVAIIGHSGSGKSTMMNILGLLDRPTSGSYLFNGKEVAELEDDERAYMRNKTIGFVFQSFFLLPRLTAVQNVGLPLAYRGLPRSEIRPKAFAMLEKLGLGHLSHHKPNQLSGGEQQRVAIARALVGEPNILLADEPTGSLDTKTGDAVLNLFLDLNRKEQKTIIIITHNNDIAAQCRRTVKLQDGNIIEDKINE